jgi:hypothetical protein
MEDYMNSLKKLVLFTASLLLALTFTISCTDDGGGDENSSSSSANDSSSSSSSGTGSTSVTETYTLYGAYDGYFTYLQVEENAYCEEGVLVDYTRPQEVDYSIENNILVLGSYESYYSELQFTGTSNELTGTWTRTKDKSASCELLPSYEGGTYWKCKEGWDIVKAEFTASTVKFTREICPADEEDGTEYKGWLSTVIDCNTIRDSKGAEEITYRVLALSGHEVSSWSMTYKGATCTFNKPAVSQFENACAQAGNDSDSYWESFFRLYDNAYEEYKNCMIENEFPPETYEEDDDEPLPKFLLKKQAKQR